MPQKPKSRHTRNKKSSPPTLRPSKNEGANNSPTNGGRFWTILGIALTAIGLVALIELSPRLSAAQMPPFLAKDAIPSIAISNDGYLQLTDVEAECFAAKMVLAGNNNVYGAMSGSGSPPKKILSPAESFTISCTGHGKTFLDSPISWISHIELDAVTYYRPWPFTFLRRRKFFKFVGENDGSKINWYKQTPDGLAQEYDELVRESRTALPK